LIYSQENLWATGNKNQLYGRVQRYPQPKPVHVYNLIAANTQDVFLNNVCFGKAAIMDAFTGATSSMSTFFLLRSTIQSCYQVLIVFIVSL